MVVCDTITVGNNAKILSTRGETMTGAPTAPGVRYRQRTPVEADEVVG